MMLTKISPQRCFTHMSIFLTCLSLGSSGTAQQSTLTIDATGTTGQDARNGSGHGGDAGNSTPGGDASNVVLNLSEMVAGPSSRATIVLVGQLTDQLTGPRRQSLQQTLVLDSRSRIHIDASGGAGGDGGDGADGRDGRDGTDGRDATEHSSGTDGGRGEDGGPAGSGSPGSDGGRGGDISIYIPIEDIHLSLLVSCNPTGGNGGSAGSHGRPGQGGSGGSGGSSHSWTERDGEDCRTVSSSRDNGNGSYTVDYDEVCTPRYRSRSNSGGSRGANGSDGSRASGDTSAGSNGRSGSCVLQTQQNGYTYQGSRPFQVKVTDFQMRDQNGDGIFEPMEEVTVSGIKVQNVGDLPSPSQKAEFHMFFSETASTRSSASSFIVPQLRPGQNYTFPHTLKFQIKNDLSVGLNSRYVLNQGITPDNRITRIDRAQTDFGLTKNLQITFPIEITPLVMAETAGAGQTISVFWNVKNISGRDFGGESEIRRQIRTHFGVADGDAKATDFTFRSSDGNSVLLQQNFIKDILNLRAGGEAIVRGELKIDSNALPYTSMRFNSDLWIDDFSNTHRLIQRNQHVLRISELYSYNPNSEFLLITNKDLERESFLAWKRAIQTIGSRTDVWDLSYYGALNLKQVLQEVQGQKLKDILAHKTIVVLNNFNSARNDNAVRADELVALLTKQKANVIFMGGSINDMPALYQQMLDVPSKNSSAPAQSWTDLAYNSYRRLMFWTPDSGALGEVTRAVDPQQRFFIRYDYDLSEQENNLFKSILNKGTVAALRTITPGGGRAVFVPLSDNDILSPQKILSEEVFRALLLPTSFLFKIKAHRATTITDGSIHRYIRDSLIYDLILELDLEDVVSQLLPAQMIELPKLTAYLESLQMGANSEDAHLLAAVEVYSGYLEHKKLRQFVSKLLKDRADSIQRDQQVRQIEDEGKRRRRLLPSFTKRERFRSLLSWPAVDRSITTDFFLMNGSTQQGDQ